MTNFKTPPFLQRIFSYVEKKLVTPTSRLALLLIFLLALLSLTLAKFFILQVTQGSYWRKLADRQHILEVPEPFFRGSLYLTDSATQTLWPLAYDVARFHLYADTTLLPQEEKKNLASYLEKRFELSPFQISYIESQLSKKSRSRRLLSNLDLEEKREIESLWLGTAKAKKLQRNALFFLQDNVRTHPGGSMLGAVVHTTQTLKDEKTKQAVATGGLELYFDRRLQGKMGKRKLRRTLKNPLAASEKFTPATHGSDIVLTINPRLQAVAEKILADAVIRFQAKCAWAIAMDPYSGKVLCFAQAPNFDIENYALAFSTPEGIASAKLMSISNAYEPGSVMKPLNIAIALTANEELKQKNQDPLFNPSTIVPVTDGWLPGRKKALRDTTSMTAVNMNLGIQVSSNVYMAKLMHQAVDRLGPSWYQQKLRSLGFGQLTTIELPSQTEGLVPTPGKVNAWGSLEWSLPTPGTLAMGHNILVNSLQMLRAYAAIANGGYLINPTLIDSLYTPVDDRMLLQYVAPSDVRGSSPKVFSEEVCKKVRHAMSFTIRSRGSCTRAELPGYSLSAKTGTANKFFSGLYDRHHTLSTCIGILPSEKPEIILLVCIDEPKAFFIPSEAGYNHRASVCCTPTFHRIMQECVGILGIVKDYPDSYLPGDPRYDPEKSFLYKENKALQEISIKYNGR